MTYERDLVGYGGRWPDVTWPNGARLAVGPERPDGDWRAPGRLLLT